MTPASRLRIIVAGLAGLYPVGGVLWDYLQYVVGLSRLGHDVYYFEDTWQWPYQPVERRYTDDPTYSVGAIRDFLERYEPRLVERFRYVHLHERSYGMEDDAWRRIVATADLFINVSGASMLPDALGSATRRCFIDTDPGYNQIVLVEPPTWAANPERWRAIVMAHDSFFTYAENIASPDCRMPDAGIDWQPTRMPVVRDLWRAEPPSPKLPWSTVTTWNDFAGELVYNGRRYRSKDAGFERILELPSLAGDSFMIALGGRSAPRERLANAGWQVVDGPSATLTPADYWALISGSRGEISPAKDIYVAMRTGWFSCRSACYLASGRPVVVEDTGWSNVLPHGYGLVPFTTPAEASEGIARVNADLARHSQAALEIASEFDSAAVLNSLVDRALTQPETRARPTTGCRA